MDADLLSCISSYGKPNIGKPLKIQLLAHSGLVYAENLMEFDVFPELPVDSQKEPRLLERGYELCRAKNGPKRPTHYAKEKSNM